MKTEKKITLALICLFLFFNPIFSQEKAQERYLKELEEAFTARLQLGKALNDQPVENIDPSNKVTPVIIEEIKKIKEPAFDLLVTNAFTTQEEVKENLEKLRESLNNLSNFLAQEVPEEEEVPEEVPSTPPTPGEILPAPPQTMEPIPVTPTPQPPEEPISPTPPSMMPSPVPPAPPIIAPIPVPPPAEVIGEEMEEEILEPPESLPGLTESTPIEPTPIEPTPIEPMPIEPMPPPQESGGLIPTEGIFPPPPPGPIPAPA